MKLFRRIFLVPVFAFLVLALSANTLYSTDLSITAANVAYSSGGVNKDYNAGEAFTAGQVVYVKTSNNKWYKAQCDGTAEEAGSATIFGIALNTGVASQPAVVQTSGIITAGGTVTVGKVYVISAAAGGIAPIDDITTSTQYVTIVGIGATASTIDMSIAKHTGYKIP